MLERLNVFYGESHVLHDLSFSAAEGRVLALLGRNGVGKSTCINAIAGLLPMRSGETRVFGARINGLAPERIVALGVGLVPQGRRVFSTLTVKENLQVAWRATTAERRWSLERVYEMFPRLKERQSNLAVNLSGGEQQMLAIGRALMTNPRLLLLDEPSEGLAPLVVRELGQNLMRLKAEELSIVVVEQNAALALDIADDAVIMGSAQLAWTGRAADLKAAPHLLNRHLGVS
ncbi:ABC transporter ATP-binding protein [Variovorax sp. EL159]|uniref:ABC transporter ATP-binding protein n=1 Tax=Variovorax sp. EL159 TaxID=1566270 RepID=UPI001C409664|nr:ABC transporter ATP-binding protein [Variovorax sp. EL159]